MLSVTAQCFCRYTAEKRTDNTLSGGYKEMHRIRSSRAVQVLLASLLVVPALAFSSAGTYAQDLKTAGTPQNVPQGAVYTLTNSAAGNAVAVYDRDNGGHLTPA